MWQDSENHDTRTLLRETRKQADTLRWFVHDWPLGNGFYRPLPTLSFILDDQLYHNNLSWYRFTNWIIGLLCAYGVAWVVWELFRTVQGAWGSALIFSAWQSGLAGAIPWNDYAFWLAGTALLLGLLPGRGGFKKSVVAAALVLFLTREWSCWLEKMDIVQATFSFRNIVWPPGRTATILALFALPCVASYCRFERERQARWAILCVICLTLSFLTYEQAVVVPPLLVAAAVALVLQGVKVRWSFHLAPLGLLATYVVLHKTFLHDTRYRLQAYRGTPGGWRDLTTWVFPASFDAKFLPSFVGPEIGWLAVLIVGFWETLSRVAANVIALCEARKEWMPALFGLAGSVGVFAPMAFQHPLAHYYYLPMAFRSIFVAWMTMLAFRSVKSVLARPVPSTT
jgi:hypothetical protein